MAEYEERTEQATPRKRQKAREEGQVSRSREVISIAATGGAILVLVFGGSSVFGGLQTATARLLALQYGTDPLNVLRLASRDTFLLLMPFFAATTALALLAGTAQGGFVLKKMELKLDAISPLSGLNRIFSMRGLLEALKSLLKFVVGGYVFYLVMKKDLALLPPLSAMSLTKLTAESADILLRALLTGFGCFLALSAVDWAIQRWQFSRQLRMSKEEIKQEHKESEGDPKIKARMKSLHMQMARRRMMEEVPKATVVITNPTHLAIAIRYDDGAMAAPKVVAKGAGFIAEKIRDTARKHGVPIVEDKPLARVLISVEINDFIPQDLYRAVARILAYIYAMRRRS